MSLPESLPVDDDPSPVPDLTETVDALLRLARMAPDVAWRTSDLVRALAPRHLTLKVILAVTRCHHNGMLERLAPATYRWPTAGPAATAMANQAMAWGERDAS